MRSGDGARQPLDNPAQGGPAGGDVAQIGLGRVEAAEVGPDHAVFHDFWAEARSDAFLPPARVDALRRSKSC